MGITTLVIWTLSVLVISLVLIIVVVKFRKALAYHYGRLDRIPSQVYNSKYVDVEYLLQGDGPTILVSHGITGEIDQGLGISEGFLGSDYPSINTEVQLETVRSPTLIINAIDDPATLIDGARTLARRMPNSQLMTMETGGHLLLGHEEEIKQQINKFININV